MPLGDSDAQKGLEWCAAAADAAGWSALAERILLVKAAALLATEDLAAAMCALEVSTNRSSRAAYNLLDVNPNWRTGLQAFSS